MSSHLLPAFRANADAEARDLAAAVASRGEPRDLVQLAKVLRISAIAALLSAADAATFRERLCDSARAWCDALEVRGTGGVAASTCAGLFDALAVAEWTLARRIGTALRSAVWEASAEYEEAFLYTQLIASRLAAGEDGAAERAALLERYRQLEGDAVDWRLELAAALEQRDAAAFEEALEGLMLAERDRYAYLREKDAVPPEELATLGCVSVEGVALWRLGRRAGFALQDDYLFVPSLVLDDAPPAAAGRG